MARRRERNDSIRPPIDSPDAARAPRRVKWAHSLVARPVPSLVKCLLEDQAMIAQDRIDQLRSASAALFKELEDLIALEEKVRQAQAIVQRRRQVASQRAPERMHVAVG